MIAAHAGLASGDEVKVTSSGDHEIPPVTTAA
jgi:hypothetical protein